MKANQKHSFQNTVLHKKLIICSWQIQLIDLSMMCSGFGDKFLQQAALCEHMPCLLSILLFTWLVIVVQTKKDLL